MFVEIVAAVGATLSVDCFVPVAIRRTVVDTRGMATTHFMPQAKTIMVPLRYIVRIGTTVPMDPWELRTELLQAPVSQEGMLDFSGKVGVPNRHHRRIEIWWDPTDPYPTCVAEFAEWQRLIRAMLIQPPKNWGSLRGFRSKRLSRALKMQQFEAALSFENPGPAATVEIQWILEAILFSVFADKLRDVKFTRCRRPDCPRQVFEWRRRKKYCTYNCAHLEQVRRSRRRRRRESAKPTSKRAVLEKGTK
ncbi:MAG: hypothetical protein ACRD3E_10860 [Terriglobales bacterium]